MIERFALSSAAAFLALLLPAHLSSPHIRQPRLADPSESLEATLDVPPHIRNVMSRACSNCHSYRTEWPWYSKIAPMNWLVESDVRRARAVMNLSEWSTTVGKRKGTAIGTLLAVCEDVKTKRMPPAPYTLMHPEAQLSAEETNALCEWTREATRQVKARPAQPPPSL